MSAREDYDIRPIWASDHLGDIIDMHHAMCDEIDRLRAILHSTNSAHAAICMPIERAKDELISTLTTHADTMRHFLADALTTLEAEGLEPFGPARDAIFNYDDFVREC